MPIIFPWVVPFFFGWLPMMELETQIAFLNAAHNGMIDVPPNMAGVVF